MTKLHFQRAQAINRKFTDPNAVLNEGEKALLKMITAHFAQHPCPGCNNDLDYFTALSVEEPLDLFKVNHTNFNCPHCHMSLIDFILRPGCNDWEWRSLASHLRSHTGSAGRPRKY